MKSQTRNLLLLVLIGGFAVLATGCNTLQGAGKDVERAGEEIQDVAEDGKK